MDDRRKDSVDIEGLRNEMQDAEARTKRDSSLGPKKKFLSVHFKCCNTYGRLYPDEARTRYQGRCPRCGASVEAKIGPGGTNRSFFDTT